MLKNRLLADVPSRLLGGGLVLRPGRSVPLPLPRHRRPGRSVALPLLRHRRPGRSVALPLLRHLRPGRSVALPLPLRPRAFFLAIRVALLPVSG